MALSSCHLKHQVAQVAWSSIESPPSNDDPIISPELYDASTGAHDTPGGIAMQASPRERGLLSGHSTSTPLTPPPNMVK